MATERITQEFTRYSHEEIITTAYEMMVATRTALKARLKADRYAPIARETREFYQAFTFFYGLIAPKLKSDHNKLRERIAAWDNKMALKTVYITDGGLERGIKLSEQLQEAVRFDGLSF